MRIVMKASHVKTNADGTQIYFPLSGTYSVSDELGAEMIALGVAVKEFKDLKKPIAKPIKMNKKPAKPSKAVGQDKQLKVEA